MAHSDFSISITDKAVDVRYTPSVSEAAWKDFRLRFSSSCTLVVMACCAVLFLPGKHKNPSMWPIDLASAPSGFVLTSCSRHRAQRFPMVLFPDGKGSDIARAAWASDETFHCDHEAITLSRIPLARFLGRTWRTYYIRLQKSGTIRFAVITSAKGRSFWGLRFPYAWPEVGASWP